MKTTSQTKQGARKGAKLVRIVYRVSGTGQTFYRETVPASVIEGLKEQARRLGYKTWQGAMRAVLRKEMLKQQAA